MVDLIVHQLGGRSSFPLPLRMWKSFIESVNLTPYPFQQSVIVGGISILHIYPKGEFISSLSFNSENAFLLVTCTQ